MSTPIPPAHCPQCGEPLPPDAPEGLCPRCVMALNFGPDTAVTGEGAPASVPPPLTPGEIAPQFPQLEMLELLGRGGMGVVYKARQKALGRLVALKLLAPEREKDPEFAGRFTQEAQALARLNHPHIVTVYDFGQTNGFFYLLMEFVDGVNLRELLRARKLTPEEALAIVPPLCEALQFAHGRGIVHRDIKPENLLLARDGAVKIADFGIAKMLGAEAGAADEKAAGTPGYMAPEQTANPPRVDSRADIYSLGVVFYEMLTGELPAKQIEPPSRKVQVDVRIDEIVLRALAKEPELRFQTAAEVKAAVTAVTEAQATAAGDEWQTHDRWVGRCLTCQYSWPPERLGIIRIGVLPVMKRKLWWCPHCRAFREIALEQAARPNLPPAHGGVPAPARRSSCLTAAIVVLVIVGALLVLALGLTVPYWMARRAPAAPSTTPPAPSLWQRPELTTTPATGAARVITGADERPVLEFSETAEAGSPHPPLPAGAAFTMEHHAVVDADSRVALEIFFEINDGERMRLGEKLVFKTPVGSGLGVILRWHAYDRDHAQLPQTWVVELIDPNTGITFYRARGRHLDAVRLLPLGGKPPGEAEPSNLQEPNTTRFLHLVRAEQIVEPGQAVRRWFRVQAFVSWIWPIEAGNPAQFQLPAAIPR